MQTKSTTLFYTQGSSDKQYALQLEPSGDGWVVNFQYGRRGAAQKAGTKTAAALPYEQALKVYEKTMKGQLAKGYTEESTGQSFAGTEKAGRVSGVLPMLLNAIDGSQAELLILDPAWCCEVKYDGNRRMVVIDGAEIVGTNRKGLTVPLESSLHDALASAGFTGLTVLDGEDLGSTYVVFDVLSLDGVDLKGLPYQERLAKRDEVYKRVPALGRVGTATTAEHKRELMNFVTDERLEGVVFKRLAGKYVEGRPNSGGDALKFKFVASCTVRVTGTNPGKRSVGMELLDGATGQWVGVGNVTIPANKAIPEAGDLAEIVYLYAFRGGSLFQPGYVGKRTDLDEADCHIGQLKYKAEGVPETAVA